MKFKNDSFHLNLIRVFFSLFNEGKEVIIMKTNLDRIAYSDYRLLRALMKEGGFTLEEASDYMEKDETYLRSLISYFG